MQKFSLGAASSASAPTAAPAALRLPPAIPESGQDSPDGFEVIEPAL